MIQYSYILINETNAKSWQTIYKNVNLHEEIDPFELNDSIFTSTVESVTPETTHNQQQTLEDAHSTINFTEKVSFKEIIEKWSLKEKQQVAFYLLVELLFQMEAANYLYDR